ncbi:MAG: hypothetical protein ABUT20_25510 [Bacteroidota bacterium]
MADNSTIQYLRNNQIDKLKWDECISNAPNGLIYGYSFYLDHMAKHWDALVLGDYETIMPLPWNKKYGIYYLYQPSFVASGGIFGKNITKELAIHFINAIPPKFRLTEISLNHQNAVDGKGVILKNNYILSLNRPYDSIYKNYRDNIKRNIKKSQQAGCYCRTNIPVSDVIIIHKEQLKNLVKISAHEYDNFETLYQYLYSKQQAITYGIYSSAHKLLASCVYFFSHNRAYYILVGNEPDGKTLGASHYLIDRFIEDNSSKDLLLDFEGSDIRNLAFFYSSFGASLETYPALRINRLPWWVKWLKN